MLDLHKALADIESIRSQVARGTQFRGYGPATVALTGVLAIVAAGIQSVWLEDARDFGGMNKIYAGYFPKDPPARSTAESRLMIDIKVEIEATAYAPRQ